jgi:phosphatidylserine decarboxylase
VFNLAEGGTVERGQRVGLIKFGSRVDVVLPAEAVLHVKIGERVRGGASILAAMPEAVAVMDMSTVRRAASAKVLPDEPQGARA